MIQNPEQMLLSADQAILPQRDRFFKTRPASFVLTQGLVPLHKPEVIPNPSSARGSINASGDLTDNWNVTHKELLLDFFPPPHRKFCKNRAVLC